ncbi:MAG: c-type cytochrome [Thermoanaerobaculia bacterium]|nr:c-type cytochrome [Thermoanaerobaculia bacterium]
MTGRTKARTLILGAALAAGPLLGEEPVRSATWEAYCTVCHGVDGRGETEEGKKKKARNLADPRWLATVSDGRLESSVRRGRDRMPAFGKKLTDEQIKALVAEVRALAPR